MTYISVFDPDEFPWDEAVYDPRIAGDPPYDDESRQAVGAYRRLVGIYGSDRLGLPRSGRTQPGVALALTIVCGAGLRKRSGHILARVFRVDGALLFVGAYDLSRGNVRVDGQTLRTGSYVKVAARFVDATEDVDRYPTHCRCTGNNVGTWVDRAKVRALCPAAGRAAVEVPVSAVLSV
ncbi:MAG: hypothetical protein M3Y66_08835 [Actinomycetota bacterium]|nr:hypothetical protein [Actinomycetota bacterium]